MSTKKPKLIPNYMNKVVDNHSALLRPERVDFNEKVETIAKNVDIEEIKDNRSEIRTENPANERTNVVGNDSQLDRYIQDNQSRPTKRGSYELYMDQIELLKKIDTESRVRNGKGINQSEIVRKALDIYLGIDK